MREALLNIAWQSIEQEFAGTAAPPESGTLSPELWQPGACFVTVYHAGELRGCRGAIEPIRPLALDVWHNARASAFDDPRFAPLSAAELPAVALEISVLSRLERLPVRSEAELLGALVPGRDGLVLALGQRRATFLPQVWEKLAEPGEFLAELKRKAGWGPDFWSPALEVYRYRTEVFA